MNYIKLAIFTGRRYKNSNVFRAMPYEDDWYDDDVEVEDSDDDDDDNDEGFDDDDE